MALKARPGSEVPEPDKTKQYLLKCRGNYWDKYPIFHVVAIREDGKEFGNSWLESYGEECYIGDDEVISWVPVEEIDKEVGA